MEINKRSDKEMNMIGAFEDTIELARNRGCDVSHFVDMRSRITNDFSEAKLGRWLGYMQGFIVALEFATLEEMKEVNKKHAYDDGRPFSDGEFIRRLVTADLHSCETHDALVEWYYGDWNSALEYLED